MAKKKDSKNGSLANFKKALPSSQEKIAREIIIQPLNENYPQDYPIPPNR